MIPGFTEEWFSVASQNVLTHLTRLVADVPGAIVEIGSWEGRSTCALARAAHPRYVDAVDTWAGSPGEISTEIAAARDVHAQFAANVAAWTDGNVVEHWMGWRDFEPHCGPVALVFIDAEHTTREVSDAIAAFLPKLATGGIVCGDDIAHLPVRRGVEACLDPHEVSVQASVWWWQK